MFFGKEQQGGRGRVPMQIVNIQQGRGWKREGRRRCTNVVTAASLVKRDQQTTQGLDFTNYILFKIV